MLLVQYVSLQTFQMAVTQSWSQVQQAACGKGKLRECSRQVL